MSTAEPKNFDGLSINIEDAASNIEKLLGAAIVLLDAREDDSKAKGRGIIEFAWEYLQYVLDDIKNKNIT
ncbi:hypothetical protein AO411_2030875 [Salmonella enterica subsp. enterica serovar Sarajane]|nr:hypothetical protein AO411_2030875 [Salmonella enterica subsp. enterica serovar Sarajane]